MAQRRNDPPDDEFDRLWEAANTTTAEPDEFEALWAAATGAPEKPDRRRPAPSPASAAREPIEPTPAPRRGMFDRIGERLGRFNEIMSADLAPMLRGEEPVFQRELLPRESDPVLEEIARPRLWTGAPAAPAPTRLEFDQGPQFEPEPIRASPRASTAVRPRLARPGGPRPERPALPFEDTGARELTEVDVAGLPDEPAAVRPPPRGEISYRDGEAIAQIRARAERIAAGKEIINPATGNQYTEDERRRAGWLSNNLAARQEREESKGGVGRRITDVLAFGQVNKEAYADIGGAQRAGEVVTEDDLLSLGLRTKAGKTLRTEPTLGESVKEEMLPFAAGQLPYMLIGPEAALVRGTARFAAAAGKKGFAEALALSVARGSQRPTAQTIAGRIGQRVVAGGVPGAFTGFGGDMAVELARETPFDEATTMAITNAGLGFLLGGAVQVAAGTVADVTVYPLARKWSAHLQHLKAQTDRLQRERGRATQTEAVLDYLDSPEGKTWIESVKAEAANAPLPEDMTPEGAARKADAQQGIGSLLESLLAERRAGYIDDVATAPDERSNLEPAGPEWWDANAPPEPESRIIPPPPMIGRQAGRPEIAPDGEDTLPTAAQAASRRYEQPEPQSLIEQMDMSRNMERLRAEAEERTRQSQAEAQERESLERIAETVQRQREERAKKKVVGPNELSAAGAATAGAAAADEEEVAAVTAMLSTGRVRSAAIRMADGNIFEGAYHGAAAELALKAGYSDADLARARDGFTTRQGFVTTAEALKRFGGETTEEFPHLEDRASKARTTDELREGRGPAADEAKEIAAREGISYAKAAARVAREWGGSYGPAAALAAGAAASDDEETQAGLGAAAALSTGRVHEGRPFYSRLARHIESLPGKQWDQPRSVKEWIQKLDSGGNFAKAELAALKRALNPPEQEAKAWAIREKGGRGGLITDPMTATEAAQWMSHPAGLAASYEIARLAEPALAPAVEPRAKMTRAQMIELIDSEGIQLKDTRLTEGGKDIEAGKNLTSARRGTMDHDYGEAETRVREEYDEAQQDAQNLHDQAERDLIRRREAIESEYDAITNDGLGTLHSAIERGERDGESFDVDDALQYITENVDIRGYNSPELPGGHTATYDPSRGENDTWVVMKNYRTLGSGATEYEAMVNVWDQISPDESLGNLYDLLHGAEVEVRADEDGDEVFVLREPGGRTLYENADRDALIADYVQENYEANVDLDDLRQALDRYGDAYYEYRNVEGDTYGLREQNIDDEYDVPEDWRDRLQEAKDEDAEAAEELLAAVREREGLRDFDEEFYDLDEDDRDFVREGVRRGAVGTIAPLTGDLNDLATGNSIPSADRYAYVFDLDQPHVPFPREGAFDIVDPDQLALGDFAPPPRLPAPDEPGPILKSGGTSKFTTYQRVPGGKNYREILVQWENAPEAFTGGHWHDYANTGAHLRMTEHLYVAGEGGDPEIQALTRRRSELGAQQGEIGAEYNRATAGMTEAEVRANPEANKLAQRYGAINRDVEAVEAEYNAAMEGFRKNAEAAAQGKAKPERVLNAFEHQSDWKQRGEEEGFKSIPSAEEQRELTALSKENADINNELNAAYTEHEMARKAVFKDQGGWGTTDDLAKLKPESPEVQAYFATQKRVDELDRRRNIIDGKIAKLAGSGGVPDMPWKEPDQVFGLTSARMLIEAAKGNYDRVAWSTAENRKQLAGLSLEAGRITYDQSVTGAVKRLLKGLGFKSAAIVKIKFDGYEHWSVKLTPEMKTAIKEQGMPLLTVLAMVGLTAEQEDGTNDEKLGDLPLAMSLAAMGSIVVRKGAKSAGDARFAYFEHRSPTPGLKKLDAKFMGSGRPGVEARRAKRPKMLHVQDAGSVVEGQFIRDNLYYVRVPLAAIYDAATDPQGIVKRAKNSYGFVDPDKMERLIARMGYVGYFNSEVTPHVKKLFGQHEVVVPPADVLKKTEAALRAQWKKFREHRDSKAFNAYSNPIGPAIAEMRRGGSPIAIATLAVMAHNEENENISRMSGPLMALAALNAVGTKRLGKASRGVGGKLVEQMRKTDRGERIVHFLNPDALLTPEVRDAILAYESLRAKGAARATEFGRKAKKLGPKGDRAVSDVIENEAWEDVGALSGDDVRAILTVAAEIADEMDEVTRMKLDAGILEPGQALPNYLPRKYAEWEAFDLTAHRPRGTAAAGRNPRIKGEKTRTLDIPIREAQRALDAARASGDTAAIAAAEDAMGAAVAKQLMQRVERGEIREASYRTAFGVEKGYADVAAAQLMKTLRNTRGVVNPDYLDALDDFLAAKAMFQTATSRADRDLASSMLDAAKLKMQTITRQYAVKGGDYVSLPETKTLGVMSGMVVKREIATEVAGMPEQRGIDKVMRFWKLSKTVFNPGTHIANVISNTTMSHMGGMYIHEQPRFLMLAALSLRKYSGAEIPPALQRMANKYAPGGVADDAAARALAEAGILDLNIITADSHGGVGFRAFKNNEAMSDLLATTTPETAAVMRDRGIKEPSTPHRAIAATKEAGARLRTLYNNEDNIFRMALYLKRIEVGDTPEQALKHARDSFGNFRTRSPALRMLRRTIAPFILYPAKAVPAFARNIVDYPWRYLTLVATWGALNEYAKSEVGEVDEVDVDRRDRNLYGYFFPGFTQLPWSDKEGGKAAIDISRWTPVSAVTQPAPPGSLPGTVHPRYPNLLAAGGPFIDVAAKIGLGIDPYTGQKRYQRDYPIKRSVGNLIEDVFNTAAPSALGFHRERIAEDIRNEDYDKLKTDALGTIGLRPRYVQPGMVEMRATQQMENSLQDAKQELRRALFRSKSPTRDAELFQRYDRYVEQAIKNYERTVGTPPPAGLVDELRQPEEVEP